MAYDIKPKHVRHILDAHDSYWEDKRQEMYRYKSVYETDFWDKERLDYDSSILIQTSDGYGYIEGYIASLFSRNPGVVVKSGPRGLGDPKKAAVLANNFLVKYRSCLEDVSRLALIYPMAFIKMYPKNHPDVYQRIAMTSVVPWQIILDRDAKHYEDQRFIGHKYYLTLPEAIQNFGNKQYEPIKKSSYFKRNEKEDKSYPKDDIDDDQMFQYIEVVELYDLVNGNLFFWSPQYSDGDKFLEKDVIPFMDMNGKPIVPIIPLYFNRCPDAPIEGYSAMKRVYDQLYETNLIRTFQANGVRKASRQYIVKRGVFDEESMAQVTSGVDGLFVEIDDDDLSGSIIPLPQNSTPPELQVYYKQVQEDKDKGSILAPFTRGESTRSSATEIAALAAYSSSEIGRLARERDITIENIAEHYILILSMFLEENGNDVVVIDNKAEVVKPQDLQSDWVIYAQDQAMTPISESVRKREFIQAIPTLQSLGVPNQVLLNEMVRSLGLPDTFIEEANKQAEAAVSAAKAKAAGGAIQPDAVELQGLSQPVGPNNLNAIIGEQ